MLNPIFQAQMIKSIANSSSSPWSNSDLVPDKAPPTLKMLQNFSRRQWESVLEKLFSVNDVSYQKIFELFELTGLVEQSENSLVISSLGYQYLFRDPFTQIWILLQAHLRQAPVCD